MALQTLHTLQERRIRFEAEAKPMEGTLQAFDGVDGYDVYNCSIPFVYQGKTYIYGRVEKRGEWARSRTMLFERTGPDRWSRVPDAMLYQLEDPNIAILGGQLILGGVFVFYSQGKPARLHNLFYRGTDLEDLRYFTTGPVNMKDIRLVELADKRIGVFSRPRGKAVIAQFGAESQIGFAVIDSLDELTDSVIENAPYIPGIFGDGEWGGCNQVYLLDSGAIGVIGHKCYQTGKPGMEGTSTYLCIAFVFDPAAHKVLDEKIIATAKSFPAAAPKLPHLTDCAFTGGIILREDGRADLYSGLGDTEEGRLVIEYPFKGFGKIVPPAADTVSLW